VRHDVKTEDTVLRKQRIFFLMAVLSQDLETVTYVHCGTHQTSRALIVEFPHISVAFFNSLGDLAQAYSVLNDVIVCYRLAHMLNV
jgi:hypothetical protein